MGVLWEIVQTGSSDDHKIRIYARRFYGKKNLVWILSCILAALLFGLATTPLWAATYYLDAENGDDSNPGTTELPWKTFNRAKTTYKGEGVKVTSGDTVLIRDGNYGSAWPSEVYHVNKTNWITYKADDGHSPEFTDIIISNPYIYDGYLIFDGLTVKKVYVGVKPGMKMYNLNHLRFKNLKIFNNGRTPPQTAVNSSGILVGNSTDVDINNCAIGGQDP